MSKFSIPDGTRDLCLSQCSIKKQLQNNIEKVMELWGYREIVTPTVEYYDTYNHGFGNLEDEKMVRFFDRAGKIVTLRMDMTVPIARVVATKFKDERAPLRFRYCANVFRIENYLSGMKNELTDCGVELVGLNSEQGDLEIICCAMEVLKEIKAKVYTLEIGNTEFLKEAFKSMGLHVEKQQDLALLIHNKKIDELKTYVDGLNLNKEYSEFLKYMPLLCGGVEVLKIAKQYCFDCKLLRVVEQLQQLWDDLKELGYGENISFDLGKIPGLNYYTGIIFEAFVENVGKAVLSGGRYDDLIGRFGVNLPAVGFSVKLDYAMEIVKAQDKTKLILLKYPLSKKVEAMKLAGKLRKYNVVRLVPWSDGEITVKEVEE
ncbi:ATP phosphoribosyltransferase regulatory subunit [Hathewaya proteolytica DSM 3090]|uniref:ATP phosphoribosyltransferase regulatory subunit n=1 Tax=Hathewaya proteolytica DSM 3090 TaxID=1121331 RepID=A0A1M6RHG6_9CLOT|nr:ATP phosphoribosyltransferase regulatory subunit [Hathewaya proteolytica]SHK31797.1 ATP phosphoribosyltransferase regulatory subunit [Hathewaya proteolytica DSM 3090]